MEAESEIRGLQHRVRNLREEVEGSTASSADESLKADAEEELGVRENDDNYATTARSHDFVQR